jgi:hypothetical protein
MASGNRFLFHIIGALRSYVSARSVASVLRGPGECRCSRLLVAQLEESDDDSVYCHPLIPGSNHDPSLTPFAQHG